MKRDTNRCFVRSGQTEPLVELVAGRLGAQAAGAVQRHAAGCDACREFLAAQAEVWAALEADPAPSVSATFDARLYRKIAELRTEPWWRRAWRRIADPAAPSFLRPAAAVSLALALTVAVVVTRAPQPEETSSSQSAAFANADMETIEETLKDFEMLQVFGDLPRSL